MSLANNHLLRLIVAAPMLTCGARGLEARQVQRMQWYVYLITTSAAVVFSWSSLVLFGRPVRVLFHLRREILQQLLALENISAPRPRETAVSSREIREYGEADERNCLGERPHATFTREYRVAPDASQEHYSRRAFRDLVGFFDRHLRG